MNNTKSNNGGSLQLMVRAISLFLGIVWRRWEEPQPGYPAHYACTYRLTIRDAARIAWNVHRPNESSSATAP